MADTFNTIMAGLPPAQIALAEQLRDNKAANLAALDVQLANMSTLQTEAYNRHVLYDSTRNAAIQAAITEIEALRDQYDIDFPGDAPHTINYGTYFPVAGYLNIKKGGAFPYWTLTDDMYDFTITYLVLFIPVVRYSGTPGDNAVIDANSSRMALMGNNIINAFHGTSAVVNSLGTAISITTAERGSVESTADLYDATYP